MKSKITTTVAGIGGALAVFSPVGRCPACFASATGVAGSLGLSGLTSQPWFLLVIGLFLSFGLWGMISSARAHRRWHGVAVSTVGASFLVVGRLFAQTTLLWIGAVLLTAGFVFDLYWKRKLSAARLVEIRSME